MAKITENYEVVYIIDPALAEEWGKRRLAYAIDYKTEGHYVLMSFTSDSAFPKELDRVLGITDGILRSMIVCKGA